ncbi:hypothetical protein ABT404_00305 [Streptomyces hyaluromycini]|uniref:Ig-like domain-containing protein n=1 Tax=Streptomyces hyaluromycini TaxID=1377993 RepID=A0ABV1WM78_9ACTN
MMNRTRRLAAFALLAAPALAAGPTTTAHAAAAAVPHAPSRAVCHVETESDGNYHLWGVGFPGGAKVTYSGSASGTVSTDRTGRFDIGGLSGSRFVVNTADGKATVACTMVHH